jgi:energy-converting hydrogenase B subunit D
VDDVLIVVVLLLVAAAATCAVAVRDPVRQSLVLGVLGTVFAVLFTVFQAPDVALSQMAVGTVLTPLLLLLCVRQVQRRHRGLERRKERGQRKEDRS